MAIQPFTRTCVLALAVAGGFASVSAQAASPETVAQELAAMRAQMAKVAARIDALERELAQARPTPVGDAAATETSPAPASPADSSSTVQAEWSGAPEVKGDGGWSFKPRGRLQFDAGVFKVPDSTGRRDGFGSEVRRAQLGAEGTLPGNFGYRLDIEFAGEVVSVEDAILTYRDRGLTLTAGHHNPFQSLEELTSDRFTSFMERAAFTDAFNFERRLGLSGQYKTGMVLVQGGLFTDNMSNLPSKRRGADARVVLMPQLGDSQLHLGGSVHYSKLGDSTPDVRYRQRPFLHFTSERFIDTRAIEARSERGLGLEAALITGPVHAAAEGFWQRVNRPEGLAALDFFGGSVELGYFLTGGDRRSYTNGTFDRVNPQSPVDQGGAGAIQVNVRYDYLDLVDAGIVGGTQNGYAISLVWSPTAYTRMMMNYARLAYRHAIYAAANGDRSYDVDAIGMRAQIDF